MKTVKILLLDDHQFILDVLETLFKNEKNIMVCGACNSGAEAIKIALHHKPDIIITDMRMPDMSGIEFIENIKSHNLKARILILSMCLSSDIIQDAIDAGANGYLLKHDATRDKLMKAIDQLIENRNFFNTEDVRGVNYKPTSENIIHEESIKNPDMSVLSIIELQILELFADGFTNKEISHTLQMNVKTIERHKLNIMSKLNLKSNVDLIKFAIKSNSNIC